MIRRKATVQSGGAIPDDYLADAPDIFFCALGYETRVPFVANRIAATANNAKKIAISFETPDVLHFRKNQTELVSRRFLIQPIERDERKCVANFGALIASALGTGHSSLSVAVDISCMSRKMLALLIESLVCCPVEADLRVQFFYAAAQYHTEHQDNMPTIVSEPVTTFFAGWTENPNLPASMVLGLGFEHSRAIGTIEDLQPSHLSLFLPVGEDNRFDTMVRGLNADVLREANPVSITPYHVLNPVEQVSLLYSALRGYSTSSRPVLVPLGPKIFALSCMLAALSFSSEACVWRVSPDSSALPVDQVPTGTIVSLNVGMVR